MHTHYLVTYNSDNAEHVLQNFYTVKATEYICNHNSYSAYIEEPNLQIMFCKQSLICRSCSACRAKFAEHVLLRYLVQNIFGAGGALQNSQKLQSGDNGIPLQDSLIIVS